VYTFSRPRLCKVSPVPTSSLFFSYITNQQKNSTRREQFYRHFMILSPTNSLLKVGMFFLMSLVSLPTHDEKDIEPKKSNIEDYNDFPELSHLSLSQNIETNGSTFWKCCLHWLRTFLRMLELSLVFTPLFIIWPISQLFPSLKSFWWQLLRSTVEVAGGCWIKLGQWISTRPDLFSFELIRHISQLCNRAPAHSFDATREIFEKEFHMKLNDVFVEFDEQPIASGAVAQVHRARLKNGKLVAVKILHPHIETKFEVDLQILRLFASLIGMFSTMKWASIKEALDQFASSMKAQIDLIREAHNLQIFNKNFVSYEGVTFPKLIDHFVTKRVLVETFEDGEPLANFLNSNNKQITKEKTQLARLGLHAYLKMMLVDNFVHADLHPGNILVRKNERNRPEIVLLDVGLVTHLSDVDWEHFKALFRAIVRGDGRGGADLMIKYAPETEIKPNEIEKFEDEMARIFKEVRQSKLATVSVGDFLLNILHVVSRYKVRLKPNIATLIVGTVVLEGIGKQLDPNINILDESVPFLFQSPKLSLVQKLVFLKDRILPIK
jgi:aarF domain-containing kinase